jgi:sulfide:quinone oxidoreductase
VAGAIRGIPAKEEDAMADGRDRPRDQSRFDVLIVGGGAAGITVAALLRKKRRALGVAIVEPSETHSYQPGWTLVGGGVFTLAQTQRPEERCIPEGVTWIKAAAETFRPETNEVVLGDGRALGYDHLVVCPGLQLDWAKVEGLEEALGRSGVCSNYRAETAEYTWECVKAFRGGTALFTQPPLPIKCAGAPQKIMYMAADHFRRQGILGKGSVRFCLAGDVLFSVPAFVPPLQKVVDGYGITVHYKHNLKAIDGNAKRAIFAVADADGGRREVAMPFDMIHVTPPQSAPDFVKRSPLANEAGWVDVDQHTMRHRRYPNVFGLGDAASSPNSKTAAAVRKQAPIVVRNLLALRDGREPSGRYDGYGSCPLIVGYGKVILAEFGYDGRVTPSFPLDPTIPRRSMWYFKKKVVPWVYWRYMLKGWDFDLPYWNPRLTGGPVAAPAAGAPGRH